MAHVCKQAFVSGRVQGVWFRQSTKEQAMALGITGYAKNLADGRVEVLMCGEEEVVTRLTQWLYQGSKLSRVDRVEVQETASSPHYADFTTG